MKWRTLIIIIIMLILLKYKMVATKMKHHNFKPDIIISPCGFYGIYNLGICHYIKNNFNIKNKNIAGLSSGSFNSIFMCLNKKSSNKMLLELFRINNLYSKNIMKYTKHLLDSMKDNIRIDDIKNKNLYIGLSHPNDLIFYTNFNSIEQLLQCCMGSSFIPGITNKKLIYFYKGRYTMDGAFWYKYYKKHIDNEKTLIISPKIFNRYCRRNVLFDSLFNKKLNLYQLYLNGYRDAQKNHNYFKRFLKEKSNQL